MISQLSSLLVQVKRTSSSASIVLITLLALIIFANDSYASERIYNGGNSTSVISVARRIIHTDFNKDGNLDMVVVTAPYWVVLYLGNGDGSFTYADKRNIGGEESAITVGDVNNDGFDDIIQGTFGASNTGWVNIIINDQAGGFLQSYRVPTSGIVIGVEVVDFDNQHGLDIAYSMYASNGVGVILSTGLGDSLTEASIVEAPLPYSGLYASRGITAIQDGLSVADVDGVNGVDLISMAASASTGYAVIWHNNGNGTFSSTPDTITLAGKSITVIPEDYDQDGYVDLLATDFTGRASIHLNNNYNGFHPLISIRADLNNRAIRELHVADVNFDTYPDIIFPVIESLSDYRTDVFLNDGTGRFGNESSYYAGGQWIAIGDLNNDGLYDITGVTTSANSVQVSLGDAPGSFFQPGLPVKATATAIATGDLNNDGRVDIVSSHNRFYFVILQNLDGSFTGTTSFGTGSYRLNQIKIVDLNNDANMDIVGSSGLGRRFVNLGNGDGTFGAYTEYATPQSELPEDNLLLADFTNDGYIDMITDKGGVFLYVNNQDGTFATPVSIANVSTLLNYGDINNDSVPDLIYTIGDTTFVKFNDGTGNFPDDDLRLDGSGFPFITDYNNDNIEDILVFAHLHLNNGDSTFTSSTTSGIGYGSSTLGMSDLDNDGDYDFISGSVGSFSAGINDGSDNFTWSRYIMYRNLQTSTAADMNNDGLLDVVMGYGLPNVNNNFSKELMFVAYNNGSALDGDTCLSLFDYDSDGHKDDCDNCPTISNIGQADGNADGIGDLCTSTQNTPAGTNQLIDLGHGVTVTYDTVLIGGSTGLTVTASGPDAPLGVTLLPFTPNSYYNISTTVTHTDSITVCIIYDDTDLSSLQEARLSLNHFNGSFWDDITTVRDTVSNTLCGRTATLSPFALGITKVPTDVEEIVGRSLPTNIALADNYPNPFNPSTTIEFLIPALSYVSLKIYNVLGQEIITLVDDNMPAGSFQTVWNGQNSSGSRVASGVYLYRLTVGDIAISKKMILLK